MSWRIWTCGYSSSSHLCHFCAGIDGLACIEFSLPPWLYLIKNVVCSDHIRCSPDLMCELGEPVRAWLAPQVFLITNQEDQKKAVIDAKYTSIWLKFELGCDHNTPVCCFAPQPLPRAANSSDRRDTRTAAPSMSRQSGTQSEQPSTVGTTLPTHVQRSTLRAPNLQN